MSDPINIYEMYGRQEERHVQELEEQEAKLAAVGSLLLGTIKRLKDGSLTVEDIELTETGIKIPPGETPEPAEASANGKEPKRVKART